MKIQILNIKIYFSQLRVSNENTNIKHKNIFQPVTCERWNKILNIKIYFSQLRVSNENTNIKH